MTQNEKLAELLFPDTDKTPEQCESLYPERQLREGARVARFAPSPTGFLHIGGLFAAMISKLTAQKSGGVFILRIEDTDKKREVENGIEGILDGLKAFGIVPDEGVNGENSESGGYGPYTQSLRKEIYHIYAKSLVANGSAYPCFCSPEQLDSLREQQEAEGVNKGYYGKWAACRNLSFEQIEQNLKAGLPYTLRLRSQGREDGKCILNDIIKGKIEMPENIMDVVLLKTDGIPTYHFAHAVDDHLMRVTHVIRGDEWISSVPIHLQLFNVLGFKPPKYAHIAPIMKSENGGKRKLSKRKDPEAAVTYYAEQGYPAECVTEYLLTLANSNFEDWRRANKTAPQEQFPFNLKKMSVSGALFDLDKLNDVSKNRICFMSAEQVLNSVLEWSEKYDKKLFNLLSENRSYALGIFSIDRGGKNPRKDIACWSEVMDYLSYFYEETASPCYDLPENITPKLALETLKLYREAVDASDDKDVWFDKIRNLCGPLGCTPNVKEYKQNPEKFRGHVGDLSTVIRVALTGRINSPDLHAITALFGQDKTLRLIDRAINYYERNI